MSEDKQSPSSCPVEVSSESKKTLEQKRAEFAADGILKHPGIMADVGRICKGLIGDNTEKFLILNVDDCFLGDSEVELKDPLSPAVGSAPLSDNKDVSARIKDLEKTK